MTSFSSKNISSIFFNMSRFPVLPRATATWYLTSSTGSLKSENAELSAFVSLMSTSAKVAAIRTRGSASFNAVFISGLKSLIPVFGSKAIICASTGNTSASAAAYAAYCGLTAIIIVPKGRITLGKLAQAIIYGAKIVAIDGNFDQALQIVIELTQKHPVTLVNSLNPHRIEGQKTAAFEIVDSLGEAPDYLFIPVGNAGNITAYWKGYREYNELGKCGLPRMMGWQAEGAAPIVRGHPIEEPETIATA
ncbi:hypothetical protein LCGC14_2838520, partial [marine sediment metagenome]